MKENFSAVIANPPLEKIRGVALVLVLSFLVVISGLVIAFFSMVTTEASSANTSAAAASAKALSDSAVSFVMGTIVDATAGHDTTTVGDAPPPSGPANAWVWASQPGMIRTFDNAGNPKFVYKLYSADDMKLATAAPATTDTSGLTNWATGGSRDVWVDMNEPLKDVGGNDVYPIVDPTAADDFQAGNFPGHVDRNSDHKVDGFHVVKDLNSPSYEKRNNNPAPMPVKWLYVLQDGTLATATLSGNDAVLNTTKATKTNPVRGRIAFWTDDECSKVNINTASQGTYWDMPRVNSPEDAGTLDRNNYDGGLPKVSTAGLSVAQPAKGEFQRYAGHPATTSLGPIFGYTSTSTTATGGKNPVLPLPVFTPGVPLSQAAEAAYEKYYTLTPRIQGAGSYGGTTYSNAALDSSKVKSPGPYFRLYASVDELLFDPSIPTTDPIHRLPNVPLSANSARSVITPDMMQKANFFITTNSSGPEVTLYNTPRVSMWPINYLLNGVGKLNPATGYTTKQTPFDQLAAFCATVGQSTTGTTTNPGNPFYFTRYNPRSSTDDFLDTNNQKLYKYLRTLTGLPIPGNKGGNTFENKYRNTGIKANGTDAVSDRDQILTCIYDYIRCTNIQDGTLDSNNLATYLYTPIDAIGTVTTGATPDQSVPGAGEVIPIKIPATVVGNTGPTQGFGRYYSIGSAYLLFFAAHGLPYTDVPPAKPDVLYKLPASPKPAPVPTDANNLAAIGSTDAMGVVFMISYNCPSQGIVGNHPKATVQVTGLDKLVFTPGPFSKPPMNDTPIIQPDPFYAVDPSRTGGTVAGGAIVGGASSHTPVLPPNGYNIISTSDVRTYHGRGIGGTAGPAMGLANGLFGYLYNKSSPDNQNHSKQCVAAGTTGNPDLGSGVIANEWNYPFYGYTNVISVPAVNKLLSSPDALSYPTTFTVSMDSSTPIKIYLYAGNSIITTPPDPSSAIQQINLVFPTGTFRLPVITTKTLTTKSAGQVKTYFNYLDDTMTPNLALDYDGSTGGKSTGGIYNFGFNAHMENNSDNNLAAGGGTDRLITPNDTVIALEPAGTSYMSAQNFTADSVVDHTVGDQRMYAALNPVPASYFQPDWLYGTTGQNKINQTAFVQYAFNMMREVGVSYSNGSTGTYFGVNGPPSAPSAARGSFNLGSLINTTGIPSRFPDLPRRAGAVGGSQGTKSWVARVDGGPGSWDTGEGLHKDGAYINKPDEGDQNFVSRFPESGQTAFRRPYIDKDDYFNPSPGFFSPNRQIPSSMMLGSIPTGMQSRKPWQTLLFHPVTKGDQSNPGADLNPPADHYMADLFWIPTVEPYAISQPFSTSGKINMNTQIQPFTYIHRDTGMRAVMSSMKMMAIPTDSNTITVYKPFDGAFLPTSPATFSYTSRFPINLNATMTELNSKFDVENDIYRSATEISKVMLIPQDSSLNLTGNESAVQLTTRMDSYWGDARATSLVTTHALTGNNLRNKPYADMYGRLTTKSNVYTVHVRAQALRKASATPVDHWVSGQDQVIAEYRGSSIIERYIDANDSNLPDFANETVSNSGSTRLNIDQYYKFRVVSTKRFSP